MAKKVLIIDDDADFVESIVNLLEARGYEVTSASNGQEGVETVLALLRKETEMVMRQAGTPSVKAITRAHIVSHGT